MSQSNSFANEEWRPIFGYEDLYEVSIFGRICIPAGRPRYHRSTPSERLILKQARSRMGYLCVALTKDKIQSKLRVHSLVARAFLGELSKGFTVNHIDGNKHNNNIANLEYITIGENIKHAHRLGLIGKGENHSTAKLKEADVKAIRADSVSTNRLLALKYNVTESNIAAIRTMKSWRKIA